MTATEASAITPDDDIFIFIDTGIELNLIIPATANVEINFLSANTPITPLFYGTTPVRLSPNVKF